MKFSTSWLRSLVDPDLDHDALVHRLTMAGLEVEEDDPVAPSFSGVVVGHVLSVGRHPDADRLNVCSVDVGDGSPRVIVCGAPNVAEGLRVPCALPGAQLPGDFNIRITKVRGVESSGMLCSVKELGIAGDAGGLLVLEGNPAAGTDIRQLLELDDRLVTLKLTPNRADCLSLVGIAREVAALAGVPAHFPECAAVAETVNDSREVATDAGEACPRYLGRVFRNVDPQAPTPEWMRRRLERCGVRSISALVDITNYVMLELGQPLHAFDNDKLNGTIRARMARPGEKLLLLNEQTVELEEDVLVIADDAKVLAMAGIMGGEDSGVTDGTRNLFLEAAFFAPKAVAGRARRYNFGSDASHRFERGVDFELPEKAMARASALILELCGGEVGPVVEALATLPCRQPVSLRTDRVKKILGIDLDAGRIRQFLEGLGKVSEEKKGVFTFVPPSYRFDLEIEEDLIEEIARIHGYENIAPCPPRAPQSLLPVTEAQRPRMRLFQLLTDFGYQEVVNYAFVDEAWERDYCANNTPVRLANPIASQMSVMRTSLIGGLVHNAVHNLRRKQQRVRVFEAGRCFLPTGEAGEVRQPLRIAGLTFGSYLPEQWGEAQRPADFFDIKGDVEQLLAPRQAMFESAGHPALHPGRAARIILDGQGIGLIGELHPRWVQQTELPSAPVVFELDLQALVMASVPVYANVSRFPMAIRDLAFVVDQSVSLADLLEGMKRQAPAIVTDISLFDVYQGKGIEPGKKSLAFRIVMQDTQKTLQESETQAAVAEVVEYLTTTFDVKLRA